MKRHWWSRLRETLAAIFRPSKIVAPDYRMPLRDLRDDHAPDEPAAPANDRHTAEPMSQPPAKAGDALSPPSRKIAGPTLVRPAPTVGGVGSPLRKVAKPATAQPCAVSSVVTAKPKIASVSNDDDARTLLRDLKTAVSAMKEKRAHDREEDEAAQNALRGTIPRRFAP